MIRSGRCVVEKKPVPGNWKEMWLREVLDREMLFGCYSVVEAENFAGVEAGSVCWCFLRGLEVEAGREKPVDLS